MEEDVRNKPEEIKETEIFKKPILKVPKIVFPKLSISLPSSEELVKRLNITSLLFVLIAFILLLLAPVPFDISYRLLITHFLVFVWEAAIFLLFARLLYQFGQWLINRVQE